jgi:hypothetical protein
MAASWNAGEEDGTRQDRWLSRTVCAGGIRTQQEGIASRLRETGLNENSLAGKLRTASRREGWTGCLIAAAIINEAGPELDRQSRYASGWTGNVPAGLRLLGGLWPSPVVSG